ncbi:MAG: Stp1/IreP family PP2C-type Ser/Thr phosphatase [Actinobacteria bacterium]|nr:Stp1/IreP family PP2C-type Ser/Thr phosphatase [Actinomycetota bacterium]
MDYFAISDTGKFRQNNEDCYLAGEDNLFIVADGMGGARAGEIASRAAVDNFSSYFKKKIKEKKYDKDISKNISEKNTAQDNDIQQLMINSVNYANKIIYDMGCKNKELNGMGTTFTALFTLSNNAYVVHTGDSRLYLYRKNNLNLLTEDHTLVFQLYKKGAISYEDTFSHPQRNYLTSVLGENEISSLECFKFSLEKDDMVLLCSDGLNSMIKDSMIEKMLKKLKNENAGDIAKKLIWKANKNGGRDNITVIVIKI